MCRKERWIGKEGEKEAGRRVGKRVAKPFRTVGYGFLSIQKKKGDPHAQNFRGLKFIRKSAMRN